MISNREDETTLTLLFKKVKIRCPEARIKTLMTDDGMYDVATYLYTLSLCVYRFSWSKWMHCSLSKCNNFALQMARG